MHAPSGMIATKEFLFVCDRDGVHQINIAKQEITAFYPLPGGEFINDIAMASNGDLDLLSIDLKTKQITTLVKCW
jgi:hypothetical protein